MQRKEKESEQVPQKLGAVERVSAASPWLSQLNKNSFIKTQSRSIQKAFQKHISALAACRSAISATSLASCSAFTTVLENVHLHLQTPQSHKHIITVYRRRCKIIPFNPGPHLLCWTQHCLVWSRGVGVSGEAQAKFCETLLHPG